MSKFDKLNITPAIISNIEHRSECLPYYDAFWNDDADAWSLSGAYLPIFTAPMSCVVDDKNYARFDNNNIIPIIPRTISLEKRYEFLEKMVWVAMGLEEFEAYVNERDAVKDAFICVDIANGHMKHLIDLCAKAKDKFGNNIILMAGNIANPATYIEYANAGIDFIRCCVGSGGACATNSITSIGYDPIALLKQCKKYKTNLEKNGNCKSIPKIVLDGGCSSIRDIIVALGLGADYVMCGKIFAKAEEAAGEIIDQKIDSPFTTSIRGRMYYGMSTERAQREMGKKVIKHSEGKEMFVPIEYTLKEWVSQFIAGISSTMSYCNALTLYDFVGKVNFNSNE